jgi:hypothetical protein
VQDPSVAEGVSLDEPARTLPSPGQRPSPRGRSDPTESGVREGEETTKEAWRKRDGEDLADKIGNAGDDVRKELGNLGDKVDDAADDVANDKPVEDRGY